MTTSPRRRFLALAVLIGILAGWAPTACGDLTVFDGVSTLGTPVTLSVRTSKFFMADGGRRVEIFLDGERRGWILTGADGYGFLRLEPQRPGMMMVTAAFGDSKAEGKLLVMEKAEQAVMIELEAAFMDLHLRSRDDDDCRRTLEAIGRRYRLIYTYRLMGIGFSRNRLDAAGWPASVVLPWRGQATLESLQERGIQIHAVIGSAEVVAAGRHVEKRFSFEKSKDAQIVTEWSEIMKDLDPSADVDTPPSHE